jgi:hypothetical protein
MSDYLRKDLRETCLRCGSTMLEQTETLTLAKATRYSGNNMAAGAQLCVRIECLRCHAKVTVPHHE